jgi:hypothetical protein
MGNTINWKASDEKIKADYFELTGEVLDLTNRADFDIENRYLHDVVYPNCDCVFDWLATEEEYRAIKHHNRVVKGLF